MIGPCQKCSCTIKPHLQCIWSGSRVRRFHGYNWCLQVLFPFLSCEFWYVTINISTKFGIHLYIQTNKTIAFEKNICKMKSGEKSVIVNLCAPVAYEESIVFWLCNVCHFNKYSYMFFFVDMGKARSAFADQHTKHHWL